MGDLRGKESKGGEAFRFAEAFFAVEDAGVEFRVLCGDSGEAGEGLEEATFAICEAVSEFCEYVYDADDLAFVDHGRGKTGDDFSSDGNIAEVAVVRGGDVRELDLASRAHGGARKAFGERKGSDVFAVSGVVRENRLEFNLVLLGVVELDGAELSSGKVASGFDNALPESLYLEVGYDFVTHLDEGVELAGLVDQLSAVPDALEDAGGFVGDVGEFLKIVFGEGSGNVAVDVYGSDDVAGGDHGSGDDGADAFDEFDVARVVFDVVAEDRFTVESGASSDALARMDGELVGVLRVAEGVFDFEQACIGIYETDGGGVGHEEALKLFGDDHVGVDGGRSRAGRLADAVEREESFGTIGETLHDR